MTDSEKLDRYRQELRQDYQRAVLRGLLGGAADIDRILGLRADDEPDDRSAGKHKSPS